jgi:UDP-N-acetyl-2-amino-2-deoxyglucuronate dehydrogenase
MDYKTAIIGCGAIAPLHAEALQSCELTSLSVVMDIDQERAVSTAKKFNCDFETDYTALLAREDIHVIHICTPHYLHASMAIEALKAGKHVLLEKPVALSREEAHEMQQVAEKHGVQIGVVYQNRYNPSSQIIKDYLERDALGKLMGIRAILTWKRDKAYYSSAEWRGKWNTEGGALLINQAIHTLDLMQWFGGEPVEVKGAAANHTLEGIIEAEDTAHAVMTFAGGGRGIFFGTNAHIVSSPLQMEIHCEQGTLRIYKDRLYLDHEGTETLLCGPPAAPATGKIAWGASHGHCINDFYSHLEQGKLYPVNALEASKSLGIVLDIYKQSQ